MVNATDSLPMPYISLIGLMKPDVRKIEKSFFTVCFVRLVIHRQLPHV